MGGVERVEVADRESGVGVWRTHGTQMEHVRRGLIGAEDAPAVTCSAPSTRPIRAPTAPPAAGSDIGWTPSSDVTASTIFR
jgi:hypothetical protein